MPINALAHMDLAALHYEWNELDVSDVHLQQALALSQRSQNEEFQVGCWSLASRLRIAQGDLAGADRRRGDGAAGVCGRGACAALSLNGAAPYGLI